MARKKSSAPRVFVTLGDGLAAGFGPWRLLSAGCKASFPARIARRLGVPFERPPTSVGETFRSRRSEPRAPHHLALPGLSFEDLIDRRPVSPLVHPGDTLASSVNLVLTLPSLLERQVPPSLLEAAARHRPTHALLCLGFDRVVAAVRAGGAAGLDMGEQIRRIWEPMIVALGSARLVVTTVPDPLRISALSLDRAAARGIHAAVDRMNAVLVDLAGQSGSLVHDLHGELGRHLRDGRVIEPAPAAQESPDFFGIDGVYPAAAGHRFIAHQLLADLDTAWELGLAVAQGAGVQSPERTAPPRLEKTRPRAWPGLTLETPATGNAEPHRDEDSDLTLELNAEGSFCQLALVADAAPPGGPGREPTLYGLFGGPALGLAPLGGLVGLRLGAADREGRRPIALDLPAPLKAHGGQLAARHLLRTSLEDLELHGIGPLLGRLDPATAEVEGLSGGVRLTGSFLRALGVANATRGTPRVELSLHLPRRRHGAAVHVDLQLRATWPLGSPARVPAGDRPGRSLQVRAAALMLYLRLTTRVLPPQDQGLELAAGSLDLVALGTLDARYDLQSPELGGLAEDRGRLFGRLRLDLGAPAGQLMPALIGLRSPTPRILGEGLLGFDAEVRFPNRLWRRTRPTLAEAASPCLGVVDRCTGRFLGGLRLAARSSGLPSGLDCLFRAEARLLDDGPHLRLQLGGGSSVSLEAGTPFQLSGAPGALLLPSKVDLRLRLEAAADLRAPMGCLSGEERLLSSSRQLFSLRYVLPTKRGERTLFEYTNHTRGGTFVLIYPIRLRFSRAPGSRPARTPDTAVIEGLGTWSGTSKRQRRRGLHHVVAVLRRARGASYVAILVDGGRSSNVEAGEPT